MCTSGSATAMIQLWEMQPKLSENQWNSSWILCGNAVTRKKVKKPRKTRSRSWWWWSAEQSKDEKPEATVGERKNYYFSPAILFGVICGRLIWNTYCCFSLKETYCLTLAFFTYQFTLLMKEKVFLLKMLHSYSSTSIFLKKCEDSYYK